MATAKKKAPAKKAAPTKKKAPVLKPAVSDEDKLSKREQSLKNARLRTEMKGGGRINDMRYRIASNRVAKLENKMGMWPNSAGGAGASKGSSLNMGRGNMGGGLRRGSK